MRALTPTERHLLERTVRGETWHASPEEMQLAELLHRQGLLARNSYLHPDLGEPWFEYPPTAATALALRVDAAFRGLS